MACATPRDVFSLLETASVRDHPVFPDRIIDAALINSARGPIPWEIIAHRIRAANSQCNPLLVAGRSGGLANTPLEEALVRLSVDPRDPWTSTLILISRLASILARRLPDYAALWNEVFSSRPIDGWPHLWPPCYRLADPAVADVARLMQDLRRLNLHLLRFISEWGRPPATDAWCACCYGTCVGDRAAGAAKYVRCAPEWDFRPIHRTVLYGMTAPSGWPGHLLVDQGIWALVLMEEAGASVDGIWRSLLSGGLPRLLAHDEPGLAGNVAYVMAYHGALVYRPLIPVIQDLIDAGGAEASGLQSFWRYARRILQDAYGSNHLYRVPWDANETPQADPRVLLTESQGVIGTDVLSWAGMAHVQVGCSSDSDCLPGEECFAGGCRPTMPPGSSGQQQPLVPRKSSIAGALVGGLAAGAALIALAWYLRGRGREVHP